LSAAEIIPAGTPTLADLAAIANREHAAVQEAGATMVQHAIAAGEALLAAREQCEPGRWLDWCADNFSHSYGTVTLYMRIAKYRGVLEALDGPPVTSLVRARELLVGVGNGPGAGFHGAAGYPKEVKEAAARMRDDGMSMWAISQTLCVNYGTVKEWFNPELVAKRREATNRRRRAILEAREAKRQAAVKRAVSKAGGAVAATYSLAERMQDALGQAEREASDSEARQALARAGMHYRRMRDEIVRALGAL
jgi:hypothetical protein